MDASESIIAYLRTQIPGTHIGETVPDFTGDGYIFLQRQGDQLSEQLNWPPDVDAIEFDIECIAEDIDQARSLTENAKRALQLCPMYTLVFDVTGGVRKFVAFDVEDHSDDYEPHSITEDRDLHVGAFRATAYLSEIISI